MGKVLGLGGIFVKMAELEDWRAWYARVLGVKFEDFGSALFAHPKTGFTQLAPFAADTDYFAPSTAPFMINLIVEDIDAVLVRAAAAGAAPLGRQDESYGRFAWLIDPAGIKVELWEPLGPTPV
ncbi:MAG TPA: VOC family protein [Caulobacteraceae bacterium]